MREPSEDDKPTVVTLVHGETTQISFSSGSISHNGIRVSTEDGNRINVQMPGMDVALSFDMAEVNQLAQAQAEPEKPPRLFTVATVLITLSFLIIVGSVSFWPGFCLGTGYFGYRWYRVARRKKLLAAQSQKPVTEQATESGSAMSRQSVRDALARKR